MSKKILNIKPLEDPPVATSSDDDDDEAESCSSESDSDSGSDEDVPNPTPTVTVTNTPVKPAVSQSDSDSGSGSESGSDFETEEEPLKPVKVPVTTSASASSPPLLGSALKRPASESTAKKRVKTVEEETDSKKPLFQRVWSEEDEITLLQGMIDFNGDTGESPYDNINGFFDSVKKNFSFKPSKTQFMEKIRGLKKKYRRKKGPFSKAHDKKAMGLGKFIWGIGGFACESSVVKSSSNGKAKKSEKKKKFVKPVEEEEEDVLESHTLGLESDWFETSYVVKSIASHGLDEDYVKRKWSLATMEDKKKLEEKYELLRAKEVEYLRFKAEFLGMICPMIFKSS